MASKLRRRKFGIAARQRAVFAKLCTRRNAARFVAAVRERVRLVRVASGRWRQQVGVAGQDPEVSQASKKQSHRQLRLMMKSHAQPLDGVRMAKVRR
jgi:hypothetical protein